MNPKLWRNKKVLITGHEGFLGSWLTKSLLELGAEIVGVDLVKNRPHSILKNLREKIKGIKGDVADFGFISRILEEERPRIVFHLAAQAVVGEAIQDPVKTFKSNIEGTWNILESCKDKEFIEGIVIASSDKAYGEHEDLPYREEMALRSHYPYDVSKGCADLIAYTYFKTYGLPVCITRCGNIYGPGDLHFSRIIPDAIGSMIKNRQLLIRSDGQFTRDYIYIEDVVRGYILLAERMEELNLYGEAFNFSNERPISVLELVQIIYKICDREPNYKILNKTKYEIRNQYLSANKAREVLSWRPKYNLEQGLERTIEWYKGFFGKVK